MWTRFSSDRGRAVLGAFALHIVMFAMLAVWRPERPPPLPDTIPIILVELPPLPAPEPEVEPPPPEPIEREVERVAAPPETPDAAPSEEPVAPEPDPPEVAAVPELADPSGAPPVPVEEEEEEEEAAAAPEEPDVPEAPEIDPRYVVEFDPFAETAPTAMARVSKAVNCSRVNRDTRPAFCPEYTDDELYYARLRGDEFGGDSRYDPVYDAAIAQDTAGKFANWFADRQARARALTRTTVGSENPLIVHLDRNSAGLQGCNTTSSGGFDGAEGRQDLGLGATDDIFCE